MNDEARPHGIPHRIETPLDRVTDLDKAGKRPHFTGKLAPHSARHDVKASRLLRHDDPAATERDRQWDVHVVQDRVRGNLGEILGPDRVE